MGSLYDLSPCILAAPQTCMSQWPGLVLRNSGIRISPGRRTAVISRTTSSPVPVLGLEFCSGCPAGPTGGCNAEPRQQNRSYPPPPYILYIYIDLYTHVPCMAFGIWWLVCFIFSVACGCYVTHAATGGTNDSLWLRVSVSMSASPKCFASSWRVARLHGVVVFPAACDARAMEVVRSMELIMLARAFLSFDSPCHLQCIARDCIPIEFFARDRELPQA